MAVLKVLVLLFISSHFAGRAEVIIESNLGTGRACPGQMVTYTCTVTEGFIRTLGGEPSINGAYAVYSGMNATLTFTFISSLNGTVVQCIATSGTNSSTLIIAGLPSPPRTPSYNVLQFGHDYVNLTVQWDPPQYDGGAPVNYTITGLNLNTTSATSDNVTLPYNVAHTVTVLATNCIGSSSVAMIAIRIANCSAPTAPRNGSIEPYQNTTEGAEITFRCNPGFVPAENMTAVCEGNGRWNPDPATFNCTALSMGLTTGQIAGIVVPCIVVALIAIVIVIVIIVIAIKKNRK